VLVAFVLGALGWGLRIWLTAVDAPLTNSDEATMGLAALHIWRGEDFPGYFYGQHYMGTIEAYLAAPLVGWLGPTTAALRIPTLALYALFLWLMYALVKRVYSPWLAAVTVGLLALGSDRIIKNQLIAGGGYPETSPMVVALLLGVLALAAKPDRRRPWVMGAVGLLAGLILWNHLLPLPYLAAAAVLMLVHCRRQLRSSAGFALLGGLVVGAFPLIWHDLHAPLSQRSYAVFWHLQTAGADPTMAERLYGGGLLGLPLGTGMCAPGYCSPWQMWWGPVYVALLVAGAVLAWRMPTSPARSMRLVLAIAALLTMVSYVRNSSAGDSPVESARYLACLLISTPAWLEPAWRAAGSLTLPAWQRLAAAMPSAAGVAMAVYATAALAAHAPVYTSATRAQRAVLAALAGHGQDRVYSDYWTCDWIAYQTGEERICAVLADDLTKGLNRYEPYWSAVGQSPGAGYLAPIDSPLDHSLARTLADRSMETVANYHLYLLPGLS
jgi:hypothetical protein